ncbi:MAG: galactonate dehydratase [Clostridia bacterium]
MKITALKTYFVKPRWLFLKVETDEGIVGWGEPIVEGRAQTTAQAVQEIGRIIIGQDPTRVEHIWQSVYCGQFYRGGPVLTSALSGIEQALWDISGKALGVPAYKLLGGRTRDKIKVYGHIQGKNMDEYQKKADKVQAQGFDTFKWGMPVPLGFVETPEKIETIVNDFAKIREILGKKAQIGIDFHGRVSPALAPILIKELEPYKPMFIEEPVLPENVDVMARIARGTTVPIATGERLFTKWGFREVIEKQAAVILQPDLSHAGGILECKKIAAMAEAYYMSVAPHCPLGPIALASCLTLDAVIPNFLCQETVTMGEGYLKEPFVVENGYVKLSDKPGLGIEVDESCLETLAYDGSWETPSARYEDGSVAHW